MKHLTEEDLAGLFDTPIFRAIGEVADQLGLHCYAVGGYVRDLFLDRPSKDIDCVVVDPRCSTSADSQLSTLNSQLSTPTEGPGIRVAKALGKRLGKGAHVSVFRNFGTAQVKWKDQEVEFVGARRESYSRDSRKPIVEDGSLEDDLDRRDFTINALAYCLTSEGLVDGKRLIDRFGGLWDMEDGLIATPLDPDITFSDDPLRMLRAVRFSAQLKFDIERETRDALTRNAHRLQIISGERIQEEFNKILMTDQPSRGIYELYDTGLLQQFLPELCKLDLVETRNGRAHKNNFYHSLEVLDNVSQTRGEEASLWLRWAALLHDIGKPKSKRWDNQIGWTFHNHNYLGAKMIPEIFRRLKLPLDMKMKYVQKLVDLHMRPIVIADEEVTDSAVRRLVNDAGDDIDDLMTLCEADITSKNEVRKAHFRENFRMVREKIADLKEKDYKRLLQPVVDGNEIMEMFHLKPSREVGALKQCLKDAVLDNKVPNEREPLMELLMKKAKQMGLSVDENLNS